MVSLLSLFGGKKKSKPTAAAQSSQTSRTNGSTSTIPSVTKTGGTGPQRASATKAGSSVQKPYDAARRRSSAELARKRSLKQKPYELPQLDLGRGTDGLSGGLGGTALGLEDIGGVPTLSAVECTALDGLRFSCEEVREGWISLSGALKKLGEARQVD